MQCCSHPAGGQSSDTSFMVLGESRDLWASPENISVFGRNLLTARFGVFLVWFVLFFKRKNDVSSNMESFSLLTFFFFFIFCLKNTNHILFWVRLMQTAPSFPLVPLQISGLGCFPRGWLPLHPSRAAEASHARCLCPISSMVSLQETPHGSFQPPWPPSRAPAWAELIQPTALIPLAISSFYFFFFPVSFLYILSYKTDWP